MDYGSFDGREDGEQDDTGLPQRWANFSLKHHHLTELWNIIGIIHDEHLKITLYTQWWTRINSRSFHCTIHPHHGSDLWQAALKYANNFQCQFHILQHRGSTKCENNTGNFWLGIWQLSNTVRFSNIKNGASGKGGMKKVKIIAKDM